VPYLTQDLTMLLLTISACTLKSSTFSKESLSSSTLRGSLVCGMEFHGIVMEFDHAFCQNRENQTKNQKENRKVARVSCHVPMKTRQYHMETSFSTSWLH